MASLKEDRTLPKISARNAAVIGAITLAAVLGWTSYAIMSARTTDQFAACRSGNVAGGTIGGPVELVDEAGQTVTDAQIFAKPALVYFGFASCADVCPLDNVRNVEVADILAKDGMELTPVFISIDPARDTPAVMAEYTSSLGENLQGFTGTIEQVKAAAAAYKVFFQIPENATSDYEVDHTTLTYLVLPQIGFVDFFQRDMSAQTVAEHAACYLRAN
jgi:protein SCO1